MTSGLILGLTRLTISSTKLSFTTTNVLQTSSRLFSMSSCLNRKLDSHAFPPSKLPSSRNRRWEPMKSFNEMYEYTIKPLPFPKTGGRGPNGRIWTHRRGGGLKREYRMIDFLRCREGEEEMKVEKVEGVQFDTNRSAHIALVASGEKLRYVIATQNMKPGDLIRSTLTISRTPVRPVEGDSHPIGSLPIGTLVNCVEQYPGAGAALARSAGVTAQLIRKHDDKCVVRLPSKREVVLQPSCTATVGRVSNIDHNKRVIGKAGRNRWLGIRPKSGRWHRKDGHCGRKIKGPKAPVSYLTPHKSKPVQKRFGLPNAPGIYETRVFSR